MEDLTGLKVSSNYKFTADPFTHLCIRVHLSLSTIYKREKEGGVREREREREREKGREGEGLQWAQVHCVEATIIR